MAEFLGYLLSVDLKKTQKRSKLLAECLTVMVSEIG